MLFLLPYADIELASNDAFRPSTERLGYYLALFCDKIWFVDEIRGSVGKHLSRVFEGLPVRYGGLGLTSPIDIAPHAFLASRACASRVLRPSQQTELNIPAKFRSDSDFNTKPQDTTTARAASSNPGTVSTLTTSLAPLTRNR